MRIPFTAGLAASAVLLACLPARAGIADLILQGVVQGVVGGVVEHAVASNAGPVIDGPVVANAAYAPSGCAAPLMDDAYPPCQPALSPSVAAVVAARHGKGLSSAGFYNDPSVATAAPASAYVEPAPVVGAPPIIYSPYGRPGGYYRYRHAGYGGARYAGGHFSGAHFGGGVHVK